MSTVVVPGAELDVSFSDEGGHPVVQLHGLTSSRARSRQLDLDLGIGLSGTRLLRYDARGHGRSTGRPVAADYEWTNLADDLLALLDAFFPGERVHGVGPSMGCATLLHAALRDPGRFSGLTLMTPSTAWESRVAKAEEYRRNADVIESTGLAAFLESDQPSPLPPAATRLEASLPEIPESLLPAVYRGAAASDLPAPAQIVTIDVPTTILAWIADPGHPVSTADRLVELLPDSSLRVARTPAVVSRWPLFLAADVAADAAVDAAVAAGPGAGIAAGTAAAPTARTPAG
jgi:pimeloyl-ACP methyl ester carboxylesterase